jgi:hypothetical protein
MKIYFFLKQVDNLWDSSFKEIYKSVTVTKLASLQFSFGETINLGSILERFWALNKRCGILDWDIGGLGLWSTKLWPFNLRLLIKLIYNGDFSHKWQQH